MRNNISEKPAVNHQEWVISDQRFEWAFTRWNCKFLRYLEQLSWNLKAKERAKRGEKGPRSHEVKDSKVSKIHRQSESRVQSKDRKSVSELKKKFCVIFHLLSLLHSQIHSVSQ